MGLSPSGAGAEVFEPPADFLVGEVDGAALSPGTDWRLAEIARPLHATAVALDVDAYRIGVAGRDRRICRAHAAEGES